MKQQSAVTEYQNIVCLHANFLKVKGRVQSEEPPSESNEHLGQRRMNIHKEPAFDIL